MRLSQPVTQGGQTFLHRLRMLGQIVRLASFFSSMISLTICGTLCYRTFSEQHLDQYCRALFLRGYQYIFGPTAEYERYRISYWVSNTEPIVHFVHQKLLVFTLWGIGAGLVTFIIMFFVWNRQGTLAHQKKIVSGVTIQPKKEVIKLIKKRKQASHLTLMDLPLIKNSETRHILMMGTTGSGKTNNFKHLMNQTRHQKAVILDTTGEFVDQYYDPTHDIIMNPFDERFPGWDLWKECQTTYHYDELAESLIPQSGHDPFWAQSARTVLSSLLTVLSKEEDRSIIHMVEILNTIPLADLHKKLENTKAGALVDPKSEKTATSIRMNVAAHIACLDHVKNAYPEPIAIKQWIKTEKSGWLFLNARPAQRSALRPLLSCWLSIAIKSLMECTPDAQRRLWFMIDELPSLHQLPDLSLCLSEGRKYGSCMVLGIQNLHQLEEIYGVRITKSLADLCSTKIMYRCASFETAEQLSHMVGRHERREAREGISYGANDTRDGVSLSIHTEERPILPPYELMNLPDLSCYVQLPQGYPLTKIDWNIVTCNKAGRDDKNAHILLNWCSTLIKRAAAIYRAAWMKLI